MAKRKLAQIVSGWNADAGIFTFAGALPLGEAATLWKQERLQKLDLGKTYRGTYYGPLRSFRDQLNHRWPALHPDVLAAIAKHTNATEGA